MFDTVSTDDLRASLEGLPPRYWAYAAAAIVLFAIVAWRYRTERRWFGRDTAATWQLLRKTVIPLLGTVARRVDPVVGEDVYARTDVTEAEYVATLETSLGNVLDDLHDAGYEPQPLASFATDWEGRTEAASWARYYGSKPFERAPDWLRARQVHVRLFVTSEPAPYGLPGYAERVVVTAHEEANPWRPDQWLDHYRAESMDVEQGRRLAALDLDVEPEPSTES